MENVYVICLDLLPWWKLWSLLTQVCWYWILVFSCDKYFLFFFWSVSDVQNQVHLFWILYSFFADLFFWKLETNKEDNTTNEEEKVIIAARYFLFIPGISPKPFSAPPGIKNSQRTYFYRSKRSVLNLIVLYYMSCDCYLVSGGTWEAFIQSR